MTTSTRIVKYKPPVTKLNPVSCKTSEKKQWTNPEKRCYMLLEIWLPNLCRSLVIYHFTSIDSDKWNFCKVVTFTSLKLTCLIGLITCTMQLPLSQVSKFYCFCVALHINIYIYIYIYMYIYIWHNYLQCPMMGEVSRKMYPQ